MTHAIERPAAESQPRKEDFCGVPPLRNGDRLSREEFYRRWDAMPELVNAERIEGIVSMSASVRRKAHGRPHSHMIGWLVGYESETPGVEAGDNSTLQVGPDSDPQPDAYLLILPEHGGQCRFTEDDYIEGGPEFIAEVSSSSISRDLNKKLPLYRDNGVQEYVVWKTEEREMLWFRLEEGDYVRASPDDDGIFRSSVFPGLWLDATAMLDGNLKQVLSVLRQGLGSAEHRAFVQQLAARRSGGA
ncbi:MAG: Uma2 family endonuclease [Planctomycetota bacterium]|nr:MAG: Uma2 family endonuclease [Planctomycetota bacterium]REJ91722.1 MAG: Uma2 family endonuclease [Planctomycetota bacterium]REK27460.1 MAG: Uma2 family endonuclease [Planctomycetota bacterium]